MFRVGKYILGLFVAAAFAACGSGYSAGDVYVPDRNTSIDTVIHAESNTTVVVVVPEASSSATVSSASSTSSSTVVKVTRDGTTLPANGNGTFANPYELRNGSYSGFSSGTYWFYADVNANCTLSTVSTVAVTGYAVYDEQLNEIQYGSASRYTTVSVDINSSSVIIGLRFSVDGAETLFYGACLDSPAFR